MMRNFKITVSYDGSRYNGWQVQKNQDATIQGKLMAILKKMQGCDVDVIGSGRTDAGVHAIAQVANFHINTDKSADEILAYINMYLPDDIAVTGIEEVDEKFHARFSCVSKTYRYRIHTSKIPNVFERKYVYDFHDKALSAKLMIQAARHLVGEHDFKAFCGNPHFKKSSVRTITSVEINESASEIVIDFTGDGFLQNMVRIMAGTLIEVGLGNIPAVSITKIIESRDRQQAGFTAPPQGLALLCVKY